MIIFLLTLPLIPLPNLTCPPQAGSEGERGGGLLIREKTISNCYALSYIGYTKLWNHRSIGNSQTFY